MLKYTKLIRIFNLSLITSLINTCYAMENTENLYDDAENGIRRKIELTHQPSLNYIDDQTQASPMKENNEVHEQKNENKFTYIINGTTRQVVECFDCTYQTIIQPLSYCRSLIITREFTIQVAASITSTIIMYGMYKALNI